MFGPVPKLAGRVLVLALAAMLPVSLASQDSANSYDAGDGTPLARWEIFVGYSYILPTGTIQTPLPNSSGVLVPVAINYSDIASGGIVSLVRYFNKYAGMEFAGDVHLEDESGVNGVWVTSKDDMSGAAGGLILRFPTSDVTPFVHALGGTERVGGPHWQLDTFGPAMTLGGGLDYATPLFHHRMALRLFEADYQYIHENYGTVNQGGVASIDAYRLSAGVLFHAGTLVPPPAVTLACLASPSLVYPGDPVTVTSAAGNLNPKLNALYSWTGVGVTGGGSSASVATASLAAGTYTVRGEVKEGKTGKEGRKPGETADCSPTFTVKAYEPPTLSCSASPSTINAGDTSTVTAVGVSPQNRPLTYSYSASAGAIGGNGSTAVFSSTGAPTGAVGITCNVADDKGQTATASTSVTIAAPYVKPAPKTQELCSISFEKDPKRPTRVDNEAKACLDRVALDLQNQADATVVLVGDSNAKEKAAAVTQEAAAKKNKHVKAVNTAAERAVNAKEYLVTEKGIDASRIRVAAGSVDSQTVEDYLVPSGASFDGDVPGTTPVDESAIKPEVRKPLGAKQHAKKAE